MPDFSLKTHQIHSFLAGDLPQNQLGELTALSRPPGYRFGEKEEK